MVGTATDRLASRLVVAGSRTRTRFLRHHQGSDLQRRRQIDSTGAAPIHSARTCPPIIHRPSNRVPARRARKTLPWVSNLVIVSGHAPHKEMALMLRTDDPEFFDCCFQR